VIFCLRLAVPPLGLFYALQFGMCSGSTQYTRQAGFGAPSAIIHSIHC